MFRKMVALAVFMALTSACATIIKGTDQAINISTSEQVSGQCRMRDKAGNAYIVSVPGAVVVRRGDGPLTVHCAVDGYTGERQISEELEPWFVGNLLWVTLSPIAALVDGISGAYQQYPTNNRITLVPNPSSNTVTEQKAY